MWPFTATKSVRTPKSCSELVEFSPHYRVQLARRAISTSAELLVSGTNDVLKCTSAACMVIVKLTWSSKLFVVCHLVFSLLNVVWTWHKAMLRYFRLSARLSISFARWLQGMPAFDCHRRAGMPLRHAISC